jgi:hypothetical protein
VKLVYYDAWIFYWDVSSVFTLIMIIIINVKSDMFQITDGWTAFSETIFLSNRYFLVLFSVNQFVIWTKFKISSPLSLNCCNRNKNKYECRLPFRFWSKPLRPVSCKCHYLTRRCNAPLRNLSELTKIWFTTDKNCRE